MNGLFFVTGLHRTSVAHSSILMGMTPLFVLLIAAGIRLEKMTASKIVGMLIAIGGVVVLSHTPSKVSGATLTGDFFVLLAALSFALFAVFGKRATVSHGSVTVNTFAYLGGGLMLSPITVWQAWQFSFSGLSLTAWASLLYMALFPSLICYLIFYYALTFIAASRVSTFGYLQPPIATLLAVILIDEPVTKALVAGGALVLTGVYVTERT
jgi:drug/metabolite transporter (DMT)-like permease